MSYIRTMIQAAEPRTDDKVDLFLPPSAMRQLKIPAVPITVQFGARSCKAIARGKESGKLVSMTSSLVRSLLIPTGIPLLMRYDQLMQCLVFGPLLGVLVSSSSKDQRNPFGSFTPFFNELTDVSRRQGGIICVFTPQDLDWETKTVRGRIRKNGFWHTRLLPLPQSIYNRLSSRQKEKSDSMNDWLLHCKEHQIPFFNEQFLNKWHVHQALSTDAVAQEYLPKTVCYHGISDLKQMLEAHRTLYAKPTNGSMGKGVYRIRRGVATYQLASSHSARTFKDISSLHRALHAIAKGKAYLLQQGLSLIHIGRRTVDFRVLVQKNGHGHWAVTSMVARVGASSVVSNVARGGTMMAARQALSVCGPWPSSMRPSPVSLKQAALAIAKSLEVSLGGLYAEFGVDLGVDTKGRIWLLEVNSKPSKAMNTVNIPAGEVELPRKPRPSVHRLVDYAHYLGGFPKRIRTRTSPIRRRKANRR